MASIKKYFPIHKQSEGHCGAANLRGIFQYWTGRDYGEERFSRLTNSTKVKGCYPEEIFNAVSKKTNFFAVHVYEEGDFEMLESLIRRGIPPLVCYYDPRYKVDHWATVLGVNHSVSIADTVLPGKRKIPKDEFYNLWTDEKGVRDINNTLIITPPKKWTKKDKSVISLY